MYIYDGLTFSDNMTISWFPNKPVHTARLINRDNEDDVKAWISGDLMRGVLIDKLHADVIIFPDPVLMYIPTESIFRNSTSRRILVQGTVNKVLKRIYKEYQKNAKRKELRLVAGAPNNEYWTGYGEAARILDANVKQKLIDQMSDLKIYSGWVYDESKKIAYLYFD
jgi:hypothetical protein